MRFVPLGLSAAIVLLANFDRDVFGSWPVVPCLVALAAGGWITKLLCAAGTALVVYHARVNGSEQAVLFLGTGLLTAGCFALAFDFLRSGLRLLVCLAAGFGALSLLYPLSELGWMPAWVAEGRRALDAVFAGGWAWVLPGAALCLEAVAWKTYPAGFFLLLVPAVGKPHEFLPAFAYWPLVAAWAGVHGALLRGQRRELEVPAQPLPPAEEVSV